MKILALESSAVSASVALTEDEKLVAQSFQNCGLTHSRTLLPMEKTGLVARMADERDARVGFAAITPAGHNLLDNAMLTARETCAELLRHAPQDQLDALTAVLGNIIGPAA